MKAMNSESSQGYRQPSQTAASTDAFPAPPDRSKPELALVVRETAQLIGFSERPLDGSSHRFADAIELLSVLPAGKNRPFAADT